MSSHFKALQNMHGHSLALAAPLSVCHQPSMLTALSPVLTRSTAAPVATTRASR